MHLYRVRSRFGGSKSELLTEMWWELDHLWQEAAGHQERETSRLSCYMETSRLSQLLEVWKPLRPWAAGNEREPVWTHEISQRRCGLAACGSQDWPNSLLFSFLMVFFCSLTNCLYFYHPYVPGSVSWSSHKKSQLTPSLDSDPHL